MLWFDIDGSGKLNFLRIYVEIDRKYDEKYGKAPNMSLDASTTDNIQRLQQYGNKMVEDNKLKLDQLVSLMLEAKPGCTRD